MRENLMSGLGRGRRKRGVSHRACVLLHRLAVSGGKRPASKPSVKGPVIGGATERSVA